MFVYRWTKWAGDDGNPVQLALAILDASTWEPIWETTYAVGPFHEEEERRLQLLDDWRRWLRLNGYQRELL